MRAKTQSTALYITQVAMMAGLLTALKFALSFLPNVEVITLLIAVFSTVWGMRYSLPATVVFCIVEMAIYGIGGWVLLYFMFWPMLAVVFHFVLQGKRIGVAYGLSVVIGLFSAILFGVMSACVETLMVVGSVSKDMLGDFFIAYYLKGLWFDILHVVSVVASLLALYIPLVKVAQRLYRPSTISDIDGSLTANTDTTIPCDAYTEEINIADDGVKNQETETIDLSNGE